MRKLIFTVLTSLILASTAQAAGTVTVTTDRFTDIGVTVITYTVTADAADGTVPATAAPAIVGFVYYMETDPGATAPTDNYDITLTEGLTDILGGAGANRDTINTERVYPVVSDGTKVAPFVSGALTLNIENTTVNAAGITVRVVITE